MVQTVQYTANLFQYIWLGNTSEYTFDTVRPVWSVESDQYFVKEKKDGGNVTLSSKLNLPDYAPFSLKHIYYLFCYYVQTYLKIKMLNDEDYTMIS